jgi:hypothetical protein
VPALLSGGLLLMFGIQIILPSAPAPTPVSGVAPRNLRLPPVTAPASTAFTLKTPLFTPSRTFDINITAGGSTDAGIELLGISRVRGYQRAFFKFSNGDVISAGVGTTIKGWVFSALGSGSARLSRDGKTITLQVGVAQAALPTNTNEDVAAEENAQ